MNAKIPSHCPYSDCPSREPGSEPGPTPGPIVRRGHYLRAEDSRRVSRFQCRRCQRSFSSSRLTACFRQKKRRINSRLFFLLCSGVSQRRAAILLRLNRKTVVRKFLLLAQQAKRSRLEFLEALREKPIALAELQFDEMESSEISKCLPVSIPLVVEARTRRILGFRVGRMPAKGPLAAISLQKYGPRADDRAEMADELFRELKGVVSSSAVITSDQNPKYPSWLKPHFPTITHRAVKGRRGCVAGQGELKKIGLDPLFSLNHTCAMLRANVNRLFRRTWCTTKRRDRLEAHLELYAWFQNEVLIPPRGRKRALASILA